MKYIQTTTSRHITDIIMDDLISNSERDFNLIHENFVVFNTDMILETTTEGIIFQKKDYSPKSFVIYTLDERLENIFKLTASKNTREIWAEHSVPTHIIEVDYEETNKLIFEEDFEYPLKGEFSDHIHNIHSGYVIPPFGGMITILSNDSRNRKLIISIDLSISDRDDYSHLKGKEVNLDDVIHLYTGFQF